MPTIHLDKCTHCLKCVNDCPSNAIDIQLGQIAQTCIHCGHCVAICPESTITPDVGTIHPLGQMGVSGEDFRSLSAKVRSCRKYHSKEVPEEILLSLVENMKHYPSASNARPVQITIVRTPEMVQKLNDQTANALIGTLKMVTHPVVTPFVKLFDPSISLDGLGKYKNQFIERQKHNSSQVCHHAPVVMLFHAPSSKLGMGSADAYIWATYTSLYAHTLGLGSCFIGFIVKAMERSRSMREEFGIPDNHSVYAALTLGFPKVKYVNETSREKPMAKMV
jgi:nitroreductase/NAD-dependent dihydropyrimidine dehydrogenase PreA subunit